MKIFKTLYGTFRLHYEIPEEYHNSFYLANATLLQIVNYNIHKSCQYIFPELVSKLISSRSGKIIDKEAINHIKHFIGQLEQCDCSVDLHVPLKRNFGDLQILKAHRSYHGLSLQSENTTLGGLRFQENLSGFNCQGLAAHGTYRHAILDLHLGGSHGGIQVNGNVLEDNEKSDLVRAYVSKLGKLDKLIDIIESDYGTHTAEMDLITDLNLGNHISSVGKSEKHLGLIDSYKISANSTMKIIKTFLENERISQIVGLQGSLKEKTFIIQGLGKVGQQLALAMVNEEAVCVGVRDEDCTIFDPSGLDLQAMFKHLTEFGTIHSFSTKARDFDLDKVFAEQCDILILAAVERSMPCHIADRIQAKIVVEAAALAVTPTADKILSSKSRLLIPDLLIGSPAVLLSHQEYLQKDQNENNDQIVQELVREVIKIEEDLKLNLGFRSAAYIKAIRHLFCKHLLLQSLTDDKHDNVATDSVVKVLQ